MLFSFEEHHALLLDVFSSGTVYFFEMSLLSRLFLEWGVSLPTFPILCALPTLSPS